jgi:hypothetical protein
MSEDEHPLLTKPAQGIVAVLALATGLGIALMSFHLLIPGLLVALIGGIGAIWVYSDDLRRLRLRVATPDGGLEKPQRGMFVLIAILSVAIIVPVVIFAHEKIAESGNALKTSARLRLHYTQNPITSEILQNENIAAKYTLVILLDNAATTNPSDQDKIKWSQLVMVFDRPMSATNLRIRFDNGPSLVYHPLKIDPRFAIIQFEGSLAGKVLDIEFN